MVGVFSDCSVEYVSVIIGTMQHGSIFVPIDIPMSREKQRRTIQENGIEILFVSNSCINIFWDNYGEIFSECKTLKIVYEITISGIEIIMEKTLLRGEKSHQLSLLEDIIENKKLSLAYLMTTSGSTGTPKGILVEHASAISNISDIILKCYLGRNTVSFMASPPGFDPSIIQLFASLAVGGSVLVLPHSLRTNLSLAWRFIAQEKVNFLHCTPTFFSGVGSPAGQQWFWSQVQQRISFNSVLPLNNKNENNDNCKGNENINRAEPELCSLSLVICLGGESFPRRCEWAQWFLTENDFSRFLSSITDQQTAGILYHSPVRLFNIYGLTELSIWATLARITQVEILNNFFPLGEPLSDTAVAVQTHLPTLNLPLPEQLTPTLLSTSTLHLGDLFVGSFTRCCYVLTHQNNSANSVVIPNKSSFQPLPLMYNTGDIVQIHTNNHDNISCVNNNNNNNNSNKNNKLVLTFVGRKKNLIKVHGQSFHGEEIERFVRDSFLQVRATGKETVVCTHAKVKWVDEQLWLLLHLNFSSSVNGVMSVVDDREIYTRWEDELVHHLNQQCSLHLPPHMHPSRLLLCLNQSVNQHATNLRSDSTLVAPVEAAAVVVVGSTDKTIFSPALITNTIHTEVAQLLAIWQSVVEDISSTTSTSNTSTSSSNNNNNNKEEEVMLSGLQLQLLVARYVTHYPHYVSHFVWQLMLCALNQSAFMITRMFPLSPPPPSRSHQHEGVAPVDTTLPPNWQTMSSLVLGLDSLQVVRVAVRLLECYVWPWEGRSHVRAALQREYVHVILHGTLQEIVDWILHLISSFQDRNVSFTAVTSPPMKKVKIDYSNTTNPKNNNNNKESSHSLLPLIPINVTKVVFETVGWLGFSNRGGGHVHLRDVHNVKSHVTHPEAAWEAVVDWWLPMGQCVDAPPLLLFRQIALDNYAEAEGHVPGVPYTWWVIVGSHSKMIGCVDCQRGELIWKTQTCDRVEAGAAINTSLECVYVGDYSGYLYQLSLQSGKILRTCQLGTHPIKATPLYEETSNVIWV